MISTDIIGRCSGWIPRRQYNVPVSPRREARTSVHAKAARIADACIAVRLRLLSRRVTSIYNRELRPHGLTIEQMNILVVAFRLENGTQQDVSRALHLEKSTVSRDVSRMCDRGWMMRRRDDRGARLVVTAAGQRLLHKTFPAWLAAQRKSGALLGAAGVASLRRLADPRRRVGPKEGS
jgi:DNA-binding MarR family transcriptional regulator